VYAFRHGGATAVGVVGLVRMLPAALITPFVAPLADRFRRERILVWSSLVRLAALGAAGVLAARGPAMAVYALAVCATVAGTLFRPVHSALMPSLCRTATSLAGVNLIRGLLDSAGTFLGPLLAAVALAAGSIPAVFAGAAGALLLAAVALAGLRYEQPPREMPPAPLRPVSDVLEGIRAIAEERNVSLLFGLNAAQTFTRGAVTTLTVVLATEVMHAGDARVGTLTAAIGLGALLGGTAIALAPPRRGLGRLFGVGVALWAGPLVIVGAFPSGGAAFVLYGCIGVGNALVDVGLFTIPPRLIEDRLLARTFTVLESSIALTVALGSIAATIGIDAFGIRGCLVAIGAFAPVLVAVFWRRLRALDTLLDERDVDVAVLREVPMLAVLPMPTIEQLAKCLEKKSVRAGEVIFLQGEAGNTFYVILSGEALVLHGDRVIATLQPGDPFGEIAVLRDVSRTATVRASTDLTVGALRREPFRVAVAGYSKSRNESETLILERLARSAAHETVTLTDSPGR